MTKSLPIPWNLTNPGAAKNGINIVFAGAGFNYDLAYSVGVRKRLLSWVANTEEEFEEYEFNQRNGKPSFGIVDSGAYTAWSTGEELDVDDYAEMLVDLLQYFSFAANLDVIPGKRGTAAENITKSEIQSAAAKGYYNYKRIIAHLGGNGIDGISRVMPIYHQGESIEFLGHMLDDGCTYIGISPSNDYQTSQRMFWLDDVFKYLEKYPDVKTHGYGVNSPRLMETYNWFSVDAASWIQMGANGMVSTPFKTVIITDREEAMKNPDAFGAANWSPEMIEKTTAYFTSIGFTIDELKSDYKKRWQANAIFLLNYEKNYQFKPKPSGIELIQSITSKTFEPVPDGPFGEVPMTLYGE